MNQVITIKWWHPNPAKDVPETAKCELQTNATIHIHRQIDQGYIAGELNCLSVDGTQYQGSWELYSNDTRNITRKIYDEIDGECITDTRQVDIGVVQKVLEKYLGEL